jgi:hypothetical protein
MLVWQAIFYVVAIVLIGAAALGFTPGRVSLALLGAAFFVLAFSLPVIAAAT